MIANLMNVGTNFADIQAKAAECDHAGGTDEVEAQRQPHSPIAASPLNARTPWLLGEAASPPAHVEESDEPLGASPLAVQHAPPTPKRSRHAAAAKLEADAEAAADDRTSRCRRSEEADTSATREESLEASTLTEIVKQVRNRCWNRETSSFRSICKLMVGENTFNVCLRSTSRSRSHFFDCNYF